MRASRRELGGGGSPTTPSAISTLLIGFKFGLSHYVTQCHGNQYHAVQNHQKQYYDMSRLSDTITVHESTGGQTDRQNSYIDITSICKVVD